MYDEKAIFEVACQIGDVNLRERYLLQVCADNAPLRQRVSKLLRMQEAEPDFLESPPLAALQDLFPTDVRPPGTVIGDYRLREQIGEGGMGVVYVAEQTAPVQRKVALKIIRPGMASKDVVARFAAERQALAMMDHPNIARVFDGGETDTGEPYFVMELVQGLPITEYCDTRRLSTRERLDLFRQVCQAVHHAHQKGIIHRDLKPSNVLVPRIDGVPVPKVIDFGVAKAVDAGMRLSEHTVYTQFAQMIGTPLYMSPEQAELGVVDVDTRSDVYSLGVLLYELLTGSTPFDRDSLKQAGFDEMRRIIREEEPPRPSAKVSTLKADALSTVSDRRRVAPRTLQESLQGELDWLVMRALEKDRSRRYGSASELSDDLSRYLAGEAIHAHPPSRLYQLRKFVRRHRAAVATVAACVLLLIGGVMGTTWQMLRALNAEQTAEAATITARDEATRANEERERAIGSLQLARGVVDSLYTKLGTQWIADDTAPTGFKQQILSDAAKFYQQLASTPMNDERDLRELSLRSSGYGRIAQIQDYLQNDAEAAEARRRAIEVMQQALAVDPQHAGIWSDAAYENYLLGQSLVELARFDEAMGAYDEGSRLAQGLVDANIEPLKHRAYLAFINLDRAIVLARTGSFAPARALAQATREDLKTLRTDVERNQWYWGEILEQGFRADWLNAKLMAQEGMFDDALQLCQASLHLCQSIRSSEQQLAPLRTIEIELSELTGELLAQLSDLSGAASKYRQVLDLRRESLQSGLPPAQFLVEATFKSTISMDGHLEHGLFCDYLETQLRLAEVLRREGRPYEAEDLLGACRTVTVALIGERPHTLRYQIADANVSAMAAELLAGSRPDEAELLYRHAHQVWKEALDEFPHAQAYVSGVFGFQSDWQHFQAIGDQFALPDEDRSAESVDLKNTIFHLHNNGREWARAELYEDAIGNFERSASLRTHDHAYDWLQLAIEHAHLGHRKEAKQWFDKAEDSIGQTANPQVELIELRDAAASLVSDHHIEDRTVIENLQ